MYGIISHIHHILGNAVVAPVIPSRKPNPPKPEAVSFLAHAPERPKYLDEAVPDFPPIHTYSSTTVPAVTEPAPGDVQQIRSGQSRRAEESLVCGLMFILCVIPV